MTCNRKPSTAVMVSPVQGEPVFILCADSGAAQALQRHIEDNSDASAQLVGLVHELPVIAPLYGEERPDDARGNLARAFRRVAPERGRLIELRDVLKTEDDDGAFWKATALWVHETRPAVADPAPAPAVVTTPEA